MIQRKWECIIHIFHLKAYKYNLSINLAYRSFIYFLAGPKSFISNGKEENDIIQFILGLDEMC